MEDREALGRVRGGDLDAFGHLVNRYHRPLYCYVVGRMAADSEAEDIVQKTFVSAYRGLAEYDPAQPFLPWLRGIALNHCRNEWKRFRRSAEARGSLLHLSLAEAELRALDSGGTADDGRVPALLACLGTLSEEQRRLLELRFVEELPLGSIGERLARSGEAVRLTLFRLRLRLASCVKRRLMQPGQAT